MTDILSYGTKQLSTGQTKSSATLDDAWTKSQRHFVSLKDPYFPVP